MNQISIQAVFLDRDGTMGGSGQSEAPREFSFYNGTKEAVRRLKDKGLYAFALTNQAVIARGEATLEQIKSQLMSCGIDDAYICPHEEKDDCACRKPKPGMLLTAAREKGLEMARCAVIGDSAKDIIAAHRAGAVKILVRTGSGEDAARDLLEHYISRGARGFGELKVEMDVDDGRLEALYELCADYELPIIFHTDQHSMTDEVGLPGLEGVLASYPDVDFVAHAHGWWAHIDADVEPVDLGRIPEGPITSRGRIWDLLAEYDNIYGDISTLGGWNALTRDHEHGQALLESHHDQLVFGSDYLFPGQEIPHFDMFEQFDLGLDAWANIRYRNIEALLR